MNPMPNPRGTDGDPCARHLMRERCTNTSIAFIERPAKARLSAAALGLCQSLLALATTRCGFYQCLVNLRVLDIENIKSVFYAPASQPLVERLIGTLRREVLDQEPF